MARHPLQEARIQLLLTQEQVAKRAGVSRATVTAAENGRPVSPLNQERLSRAVGKQRTDLFPETEAAEAVS